MTEEEKLIQIAQWSKDESEQNKAMAELREKYDPTYGYCTDCDFLVVTEKECCMHPDNVKAREELSESNENLGF